MSAGFVVVLHAAVRVRLFRADAERCYSLHTPAGLEDLQNLLHPEVEDHIRTTASGKQFKRTQWKRIRLTLQYLGDLGRKCRNFLRLGQI